MRIGLVFPHQLFKNSKLLDMVDEVVLIEDYLFFKQYTFHTQKIVFHRASMKAYADTIQKPVTYIDSLDLPKRKSWKPFIQKKNPTILYCYEVVDQWLEADIRTIAKELNVELVFIPTPAFINTKEENTEFFKKGKRPFMKTFYEYQRNKTGILMEGGEPVGGVYSFDTENRKKLPKGYIPPSIPMNVVDSLYIQEAKEYVRKNFADNYGLLDTYAYAVTHRDAELLLKDFVTHRLSLFGPYEDAISDTYTHIQHSVLSPYINVGLLTPKQVLDAVLEHNAPIQSVEGFVRQVLGWREFIRAMYDLYGVEMRTKNFFNHTKKLPQEFWTAGTKNKVLDTTIERVLTHAYCHHIERLMVLGNYMLLSETDPHDVYRWFMELFIDSYDWVMVPNVYGMSQFADGGIFATKPYICASNYIQKMSNYKKDGVWDKKYDQKFWEFLKKHRDFFSKNPRFKMLIARIGK